MAEIRKRIFITGGVICLAFGVIGILIPVLPTTPFLLLAAYFFARGSDRALRWLLFNRWFGPYIRNYREGKGMAVRHKVITLALLWLTIGLSITFATENVWIRAGLLAVAVGVTTHLLRVKTFRPEIDALQSTNSTNTE